MSSCKSIGCPNPVNFHGSDFCASCISRQEEAKRDEYKPKKTNSENLAAKYPQYYKAVGEFSEIDVYAVHHLFDIQDPAGCLQHASKKILLSGVRTGGKSAFHDIKEARDTLTRWLQLNGNE